MPTTGLAPAELGQHRDAAGGPEGFVESTAGDAEEDDVNGYAASWTDCNIVR